MKKAILVVAAPRSGTSVVSHVLSKLGVDFGDPRRFVDPKLHSWNPAFFELLSLNKLNDEIFDSFSKRFVDFDWIPEKADFDERLTAIFKGRISRFIEEEFSDAKIIGLKDTRFCFTLPLWETILEQLGFDISYVLVRRSAYSTFCSNKSINKYSSEINFRLVAQSSLLARHFVEGGRFITVHYEDLLDNQDESVTRICDGLDLDHSLIKEASSVIQVDLQHNKTTSNKSPYSYFTNVIDSVSISPDEHLRYREIFDAATFERGQQIDSLAQAVAARDGEIAGLNEAVAERDARIEALSAELKDLREAVAARDGQIAGLNEAVAERDARVEALSAEIKDSREAVAAHDERTVGLNEAVSERDERIVELAQAVAVRDGRIDSLAQALAMRDRQISELVIERMTYGARIGRLLSRTRSRYLPLETVRGLMFARLLRLAASLYRRGFSATYRSARDRLRARRAKRPDAKVAGLPPNAAEPPEYSRWIAASEPTADQLDEQRHTAEKLRRRPLISVILPVYKVSPEVLEATVDSLRRQTYPAWEACIAYADPENEANWQLLQRLAGQDSRIRPLRMADNAGISGNSNAALAMARGAFIALLDHDDELTPWALYDMAMRIADDPEIDFLYSDKDCIDASGITRQNPLFKPTWSPEMLFSVNYLTHLNVMRRSIVEAVGGFRSTTDGAQDWDLFYRVTEQSRKIERVTSVHYHWRIIPTSTSSGLAAKPYAALAQLRTQEDRIRQLGLPATVVPHDESGFRLLWRLDDKPCVDLVIRGTVTDGQLDRFLKGLRRDLGQLIASVSLVRSAPASGWRPRDGDTLGAMPVRQVLYDGRAGETDAMVQAAHSGTAPVLIFVDATLIRLEQNWLCELAGWVLLHPEIAFAGAIVLTDQDRVVEVGRIVDKAGRSLPLFRDTPLYHWGPFGGPLWFRNVSAVSPYAAACKREDWNKTEDMDTDRPWLEAFTARCLSMRAGGRRGLVTPHARVYLDALPDEPLPAWDKSFAADPYFHPAFGSVSPLIIKK